MGKNTILIVISAIIMAASSFLLYAFISQSSDTPDGYTKVKSYVYPEPTKVYCQALIPKCGHCPGKVIEKSCYQKKT